MSTYELTIQRPVTRTYNRRRTVGRHLAKAKTNSASRIAMYAMLFTLYTTFIFLIASAIFGNHQATVNATSALSNSALTPLSFQNGSPSGTVLNNPDLLPVAEDIEEEETISYTTSRLGVTVDSYDMNTDYTAKLSDVYEEAKVAEDPEHLLALAEIYESQRNVKILDNGWEDQYEVTNLYSSENTMEDIVNIVEPFQPYYNYTEAELQKAAAVVYAEAGSNWISDEHQQAVASVILNRITSGRFPYAHDVFDVVYAQGQYPSTCNATYYDERTYENTKKVFDYGPPEGFEDAVWQANFKQGTRVIATYTYSVGRPTYICS